MRHQRKQQLEIYDFFKSYSAMDTCLGDFGAFRTAAFDASGCLIQTSGTHLSYTESLEGSHSTTCSEESGRQATTECATLEVAASRHLNKTQM
ncbi:hypothetical protein O181_001089 [Austropuccinia psidii MF-1]|uniref:Uncharacterized protein n=1 Tax=Austropuccinia psidii MF-1 TaxID=1389203 RepID=A0A9Q3B9T3_9BASI|nr:hypothetical protein [Austropuccinia psidii MF-1]